MSSRPLTTSDFTAAYANVLKRGLVPEWDTRFQHAYIVDPSRCVHIMDGYDEWERPSIGKVGFDGSVASLMTEDITTSNPGVEGAGKLVVQYLQYAGAVREMLADIVSLAQRLLWRGKPISAIAPFMVEICVGILADHPFYDWDRYFEMARKEYEKAMDELRPLDDDSYSITPTVFTTAYSRKAGENRIGFDGIIPSQEEMFMHMVRTVYPLCLMDLGDVMRAHFSLTKGIMLRSGGGHRHSHSILPYCGIEFARTLVECVFTLQEEGLGTCRIKRAKDDVEGVLRMNANGDMDRLGESYARVYGEIFDNARATREAFDNKQHR